MILEEKFWYYRVLETDGRITTDLTFAGAVLFLIGIAIAAVVIGTLLFAGLTALGIHVV